MRTPLQILLADDDSDDRFFFEKAIRVSPTAATLTMAENGEKLMQYLATTEELPDVLFLDLNMPRKNGSECLKEIKQNEKLRALPVIIYSTSLHEEIADILYEGGAHFYIKKTDLVEMQKVLNFVLSMVSEEKFTRPDRAGFILSSHTFNTA